MLEGIAGLPRDEHRFPFGGKPRGSALGVGLAYAPGPFVMDVGRTERHLRLRQGIVRLFNDLHDELPHRDDDYGSLGAGELLGGDGGREEVTQLHEEDLGHSIHPGLDLEPSLGVEHVVARVDRNALRSQAGRVDSHPDRFENDSFVRHDATVQTEVRAGQEEHLGLEHDRAAEHGYARAILEAHVRSDDLERGPVLSGEHHAEAALRIREGDGPSVLAQDLHERSLDRLAGGSLDHLSSNLEDLSGRSLRRSRVFLGGRRVRARVLFARDREALRLRGDLDQSGARCGIRSPSRPGSRHVRSPPASAREDHQEHEQGEGRRRDRETDRAAARARQVRSEGSPVELHHLE